MIAEAKAEGDISENAGYDEAKTAQGFLEGRIRELETLLKSAKVIADNDAAPNEVSLGRTVVVRETGTDYEESYTIVGPPEADPAVQNQLGVQQRKAGQFAAAQAAYERALTLDPNYADAERNLAILHDLYLDNPSAALPHFERYQLLTQGADTQVTAWVAELKARIAAVTRTAETTP